MLRRRDETAKRALDLLLAGAGLLLLWPFMLVLAWLVRRDSAGPILYRAQRIGRGGQPFAMLKYRTMYVGSDAGAGITGAVDRRITPLGARLRAYRFDELPQLINVVRGEMSLVGPRPEAPQYVALYSPEQRAVLTVRPGITGATQLLYHDEASLLTGPDVEAQYVNELLPAKLASDLDYIRRRTIWLDLLIIGRTVWTMIRREPTAAASHQIGR